jgi:hypothetical protein
MSDHIPDLTKMISDTPRMQSALLDHPDAGFAKIWQVGCDIERELTTAQARIKQLEESLESSNTLLQLVMCEQNHLRDLRNKANERIQRLEEAGDEAIYKTNLFDRELHWNKAKEAKL